jgi:hypothetical protein
MNRYYLFVCFLFAAFSGLTAQPVLEWATQVGTPASFDGAAAIAVDDSGNVIVAGSFKGTADFDPGPGTTTMTSNGSDDIFLAKYDAAGNFLWVSAFGFSAADEGNSVAFDPSGNIYLAATFDDSVDLDPGPGVVMEYASGSSDFFFAKYDASGNYVWSKKVGGIYYERATCITVDQFANTYLTGDFSGTVDFDPGVAVGNLNSASVAGIFIAKYDPSGNYTWAKALTGSGGTRGSFGVKPDAAGNVFICGGFSDTTDFDPGPGIVNRVSAGSYDAFFAKYDASGNYIWAHTLGAGSLDMIRSIAVDPAGNVVCGGQFTSTVDFDPGAATAMMTATGYDDAFFAKYDALGNFVWAKKIGSAGSDLTSGVEISAAGNIYVAGNFYGPADFDPGAGQAILNTNGYNDAFYGEYDPNGNYYWAAKIGGSGTDQANALTLDQQNNVYVAGIFTTGADFDPGATIYNLTTIGYVDAFFAKYGSGPAGISSTEINDGLTIYPNPSAGIFTLTLPYPNAGARITIFNTVGEVIEEKISQAQTVQIDLAGYPDGIYFIRMMDGEVMRSEKIVICR